MGFGSSGEMASDRDAESFYRIKDTRLTGLGVSVI